MLCVYFSLILFPGIVLAFDKGSSIQIHDAPYMVLVVSRGEQYMTGILVSTRHVLMYPILGSLMGLSVQLKTNSFLHIKHGAVRYKVIDLQFHPNFQSREKFCTMILTLEMHVQTGFITKPIQLPDKTPNPQAKFVLVSSFKEGFTINSVQAGIVEHSQCTDKKYDKTIHVCVNVKSGLDDVGSFMIHEGVLYGLNIYHQSVGSSETTAYYVIDSSLDWIKSIINTKDF